MASVTKSSEEKSMADEELPDKDQLAKNQLAKTDGPKGDKSDAIDYGRKSPAPRSEYFTIYKRGQGYWTRMGTLAAAILIGGFTAYTIYQNVPTFLPGPADVTQQPHWYTQVGASQKIAAGLAIGFLAGFAWLCWKLMNKPTYVDFLIATDSEMKKVNWTSRKELVGSTQIVVIFMFMVAFFLFTMDQVFGWIMFFLHVLNVDPMGNSRH